MMTEIPFPGRQKQKRCADIVSAGEWFGIFLSQENWPLPDVKTSEQPSEKEIRAELDRLLQSPIFLQSDRLARFLRFAIENALAGSTDNLKEYVIGTEVYQRRPPYHPSQDSIVRTEARRLRAKLKEYYESEGRLNPVFIYFRPGTYVPLFRRNELHNEARSNHFEEESAWLTKGAGVTVGVLPLLDLSGHPLSARCAQAVTDELIHHLTRTDGVRVIARATQQSLEDKLHDAPALSRKFGIQVFVEGTVREDFNRLLVTARVLDSDGFQLSSHRFETVASPEALAQVQEKLAIAFVNRARPEISHVRHRSAAPGALVLAVYPLVMHAETLLDEGSEANLQAAMSKFQEAARLAPVYARSWCGMSNCHTEAALRGTPFSATSVSAGRQAALRAMELDPGMIEPYSCMASVQALEWDWKSAEKNFQHSLSLGKLVSASRRYGLFLAAQGRNDEAEHYLDIAEEGDPFSNRQKESRLWFLHLTRRFDEALRRLSGPPIYGTYPLECQFLFALISAEAGDTDRAKQLIESIRAASAGHPPMMAGIAEVLALCGETGSVNQIIDNYRFFSGRVISRVRQALLALALKDQEQAMTFLVSALEEREAELLWIATDPRFDSLRETESFRKIVRQVLPA
jgi:TolB-like protein/tetratricopeptide (TPR) repeat protein